MFDRLAKQLERQTLGKNNDFSISQKEFDDFCKYYLFEQIKGESNMGKVFCDKFNIKNYVLETLPNKSAKQHIETFYVR